MNEYSFFQQSGGLSSVLLPLREFIMVDGTASFGYRKNEHAGMEVLERMDDAIAALLEGQVAAVVSDTLALRYHATQEFITEPK